MINAQGLIVRRSNRLVLDRVSLAASRDVTVGIIGPNGAGKSTLLMALYRALETEGGRIEIDGSELTSLSRREIAQKAAVVVQSDDAQLPLTVRDSVGLGRYPHRSLLGYGDADDREIVEDALRQVNAEHLGDRMITELSGGERQRVLLARAIAQRADHLLLDEPTNHLDIQNQFLLLDLVHRIPATKLIVLHDLNLAAQACDELVLLRNGRLEVSGPTEVVLDPDLISRVYQVNAEAVQTKNGRHLIFSPLAGVSAERLKEAIK